MPEHDPHSAELLEAFAGAGLSAMEDARPDPEHAAVVIGIAPCGCFALETGGLTRHQTIDVLITALREAIEATGGVLNIDVQVARTTDPVSSTNTAPGPAA